MVRHRSTSLKKGTIVYHGTSQEEFDVIEVPAWFTTSMSVADVFVWRHRGPAPRVMVFQTVRALKLVLIESQQELFDAIMEAGADPVSDMREIAEIFAHYYGPKYDGWIIPDNYPDGDDILLFDPVSDLEFVGTLKREK